MMITPELLTESHESSSRDSCRGLTTGVTNNQTLNSSSLHELRQKLRALSLSRGRPLQKGSSEVNPSSPQRSGYTTPVHSPVRQSSPGSGVLKTPPPSPSRKAMRKLKHNVKTSPKPKIRSPTKTDRECKKDAVRQGKKNPLTYLYEAQMFGSEVIDKVSSASDSIVGLTETVETYFTPSEGKPSLVEDLFIQAGLSLNSITSLTEKLGALDVDNFNEATGASRDAASNISAAAKVIQDFITSPTTLAAFAKESANTVVENTTSYFSGLIEKLQKMLPHGKKILFFVVLLASVALAYKAYLSKEMKYYFCAGIAGTMAVMLAPSGCDMALFAQSVSAYFTRSRSTSLDSEFEAEAGDDLLGNAIRAVILGLFASKIRNSDGTKSLTDQVDLFLATSGRKTEALTDYIRSFISLIEKCVNVALCNLGYSRVITLNSSVMPEVDEIYHETMEVYRRYELHDFPPCQDNYDLCVSLSNRADALIRKIPPGNEGVNIRTLLSTVSRLLMKITTAFNGAAFMNCASRQEPVGLLLMGPPGVGKSMATKMLHVAVTAATLPKHRLQQFYKNPFKMLYSRQVEHEYHDGWHDDVWVCLYDDIGQQKDSQSNPCLEFMEIIRAINVMPNPLHMAELSAKASTYFKAPFVFASTNLGKDFKVESLTSAQAVKRRFKLCYTLRVKPEFTKSGDPAFGGQQIDEIDETKLKIGPHGVPDIDNDIYEFVCTPLIGDKNRGCVLSFKQLVDELVSAYHINKARHEQFNASLKSLAEKTYGLRGDFEAQMDFDQSEDAISTSSDRPFLRKSPDPERFQDRYEFVEFSAGDEEVPAVNRDWLLVRTDVDNSDEAQQFVKRFKKLSPRFMHLAASGLDRLQVMLGYYQTKGPLLCTLNACITLFGVVSPGLDIFGALIDSNAVVNALVEDYEFDNSYSQISDSLDAAFYPKAPRFPRCARLLKMYTKIKSNIKETISQMYYKSTLMWIWDIVCFLKHPIVYGGIIGGCIGVFFDFIGKWWREKASPVVSPDGEENLTAQSANMSGRPQRVAVNRMPKPRRSNFVAQGGDGVPHDRLKANAVIMNNMYEFHLERFSSPGTFRRSGFALFVQGRVLMVPNHFVTQMSFTAEDHPEFEKFRVRLVKCGNSSSGEGYSFDIPVSEFLDGVIGSEDSFTMDCACVALARRYPCHKSIVKHFFKMEYFQKSKDWNVRLLFPTLGHYESIVTKAKTLSCPVGVTMTNANTVYEMEQGFRYIAPTHVGDCGGLCTLSSCNTPEGFILGMHVAGGADSQTGIANFIPREFVVSCLDAVPLEFKVVDKLLELPAYTSQMDADDYVHAPDAPDLPPRFTPLMRVPKSIVYPGASNLIRSRLYDAWGPHTTAPAKQRTFVRNDEIIDPYQKALSKYCTPWVNFDPDMIEACAESYGEYIAYASHSNVEARVYSFEEAIVGTGDPDFGSIARNTSPGYPISQNPDVFGKKKFGLLGEGEEYSLDNSLMDTVRDRVTEVIGRALSNRRCLHIFTDNLKDERRPIEKVREGKTRLFNGCPFDYHIAVRQYFGAFSLWFIKNRATNGSAIGVNPYSIEWHDIALRLIERGGKGQNFGAGDYSAYDGSAKPDIQWAILDIINRWYNDGPANSQVRSILWYELTNSRHIRGSLVYNWFSSLPSGHPLTAMVNTMYNNIVMRMAWCSIRGSYAQSALDAFHDNVYLICLGDDNLFGVTDEYREIFNEVNISKVMKGFGLIYTSETKGEFELSLRKLSDVEFLKRSFVFDQKYQRYIAPLRLDVILEIPYWTRKIPNMKETIEETNLQVSLDELSLHGAEVFGQYAGVFLTAAYERMYFIPKRSMFRSCKDFILNLDAAW
jgi:hypothetical protein